MFKAFKKYLPIMMATLILLGSATAVHAAADSSTKGTAIFTAGDGALNLNVKTDHITFAGTLEDAWKGNSLYSQSFMTEVTDFRDTLGENNHRGWVLNVKQQEPWTVTGDNTFTAKSLKFNAVTDSANININPSAAITTIGDSVQIASQSPGTDEYNRIAQINFAPELELNPGTVVTTDAYTTTLIWTLQQESTQEIE